MFQPSDDYALKQQTNNNNSFRDSDNLSTLYTDPNLNIQSHAAAVELLSNGGVVNRSNLSTDNLSVPPANDPCNGVNSAPPSSSVNNGVQDSVTSTRNNSTSANFSEQSQHLLHDNGNKRLHVSNIPFRFRDHDLRSMFEVRCFSQLPCFPSRQTKRLSLEDLMVLNIFFYISINIFKTFR